jgi:hypothetical protein
MTPLPCPRWSTAGHGLPPAPTAAEQAPLAEHLQLCRHHREHLVGLRCAADAVMGLLGGRIVSTATVLILLGGSAWLLWL